MALFNYCRDPHIEGRILSALWEEFYPNQGPRPQSWQPSPPSVAQLRLEGVPGLGVVSLRVIRRWLANNGVPPPMKQRLDARESA
jgi:hypothetical protein